MTARFGAVTVLALAAACGSRAAPPTQRIETAHVHLASGTAAVVGESAIPVSLVAGVARAEGIEPRFALDRLIADALAAEGAHASGEDRDPNIAWVLESIHARAVAESIRVTTRAAGPPTDAEVSALTAKYWREVDLPEQVKVIHALVVRPKDLSQTDAARALAGQLATALSAAKSEDEFNALAHAVHTGSLELVVQPLPAFVQDGRTSEGEPIPFDPAFARGAFALKKPGDTSGVVESSSGWHVIRLVERRPPKILSLEQRRAQFAEEVYARRGRDALVGILTARRAVTSVGVRPDAEGLMATVSTSAPP